MPTFNSMGALNDHIKKYMKKQIDSVLKEEVAELVKKTEAESAQEVVYDVYTPSEYRRRSSLVDTGNMEDTVKEGVLTVTTHVEFNPGYNTVNHGEGLVGLVEHGHGYGGHYYDYPGDPYANPRPFIQTTRDRLKDGRVKDALKKGLASRGINVK